MSTELHCYFIAVSSHNIPFFFLPLSVHYFKLVKCQCVVLKQIAVPSSEVLTFISWNHTGISTLGSE